MTRKPSSPQSARIAKRLLEGLEHPPRRPKPAAGPKRKQKPPSPPATAQPDPNLPYWLPSGVFWERLPDALKHAVSHVLAPAYRQFVVDTPDPLQQSVGITLVHLIWLEVCDQLHMANAVSDPSSIASIVENPEEMTSRHLHLVAAKCNTTELLLKLRLLCEALQRDQLPSSACLPPPSIPVPLSPPHPLTPSPCHPLTPSPHQFVTPAPQPQPWPTGDQEIEKSERC